MVGQKEIPAGEETVLINDQEGMSAGRKERGGEVLIMQAPMREGKHGPA